MSTPSECCKPHTIYSATVTAKGYAYVKVVTPYSLVTSTATATATSNVSYKNAYDTALCIAKKNAYGIAKNNANIITQTLLLSSQTQSGTGYTGPQGFTGAQGPQGLDGSASNTGATGPQGFTGNVGPQGLNGSASNTGATGPKGPQGLDGSASNTGATGPQGPAGGGSVSGTTTVNLALIYETTQTTTTPISTGVSTLVGVTGTTSIPPNLQITFTALTPTNSLLTITNLTPLANPGNSLVTEIQRAYLLPLNTTVLVLSAASSSIVDPDRMFYTLANTAIGIGKYVNVNYNSSTLGTFSINSLFSSSNTLLSPVASVVGTVSTANTGTQFVGFIISMTFDNSVL